jgi:hypothetical protein
LILVIKYFKNTTHNNYYDGVTKNENYSQPIPVATLFKAWVGGCSLVGVRNPPVAWMSVVYYYCVLSGRGFCPGLITRPEEPYRVKSQSLDNEEALAH